jgi:hypothetical protein
MPGFSLHSVPATFIVSIYEFLVYSGSFIPIDETPRQKKQALYPASWLSKDVRSKKSK